MKQMKACTPPSAVKENLSTYDFFIPLPEAVRLPEGLQIFAEEIDNIRKGKRQVLRYVTADGLKRRINVRIEFSRIKHNVPVDALAASYSALTKFYGLKKVKLPPEANIQGYLSIAHVGVIGPQNATDAQLSDYFDEGMSTLRQVLKTYYAKHRLPLNLPSRQNIGAMIPYTVENIDSKGLPENGHSTLSLGMLLTGGQFDIATTFAEPLSSSEASTITKAQILDSATLLEPYMDAYREATAAESNGEYLAASVLFTAAIEIYLDIVLQLMMWEEGMSPEEANYLLNEVKVCGCENCTAKISTTLDRTKSGLYKSRLGGSWDIYKDPLMKRWQAARYIRNAAVHSGQEPSVSDTKDIHRTLDEIVAWIIDLLCTSLSIYPVTTFALAGRIGLEKRDRWDEYQALEIGDVPVSISKTFGNWRNEIARLHPYSSTRKTVDASCDLVYLLHPNGKRYWLLCDFAKQLFRYTSTPKLNEEAKLVIASVERKYTKGPPGKGITIRLDNLTRPVDHRKKVWHPLYLISSDYGITCRPTSFTMPEAGEQ